MFVINEEKSSGPSLCLKSTKQILMTEEERGGIVGIYSSGVKMTLNVRKPPMDSTQNHICICIFILFQPVGVTGNPPLNYIHQILGQKVNSKIGDLFLKHHFNWIVTIYFSFTLQ